MNFNKILCNLHLTAPSQTSTPAAAAVAAAAAMAAAAAQPKKKSAEDSSNVAPETGGSDGNNPDRFCSICQASFNNPLMAQQHYVGKRHRKQITKQKLMETYGPSTAPGPTAWTHWSQSVKITSSSKFLPSVCADSFHTEGLPVHHLQHWTEFCGAVPVPHQWRQTQEPVHTHTPCASWPKCLGIILSCFCFLFFFQSEEVGPESCREPRGSRTIRKPVPCCQLPVWNCWWPVHSWGHAVLRGVPIHIILSFGGC